MSVLSRPHFLRLINQTLFLYSRLSAGRKLKKQVFNPLDARHWSGGWMVNKNAMPNGAKTLRIFCFCVATIFR